MHGYHLHNEKSANEQMLHISNICLLRFKITYLEVVKNSPQTPSLSYWKQVVAVRFTGMAVQTEAHEHCPTGSVWLAHADIGTDDIVMLALHEWRADP